jgi:multidrug efflux pump subunit AcrA (membrane-fusion protein)
MPERKHKKRKKILRVLKTIFVLFLIGMVGLVGWIYLVPMVTADAVAVYDSYTVGTGDISTTKSFSATLSVKKSETITTTEECTIKELYVQSGDEVKEGDSIVLLSTGELFTASFDGVVNEIRMGKGDWVWPNFTVAQINDLEHLEVSMDVDEYDIEQLSLGQTCTVRVISLGMDFDTVIAHVNRVSQSQGSVAFYSVSCDLTVPENVLPGMQVTVTLPDESVQGVTTLDMAALAFDEEENPYVLLKGTDDTYERQYVKTGLSDGMKVEITEGLTTGQTIYVMTGTESVQPAITLEGLYKSIVGETVVVNDMSSRGSMGTMPQWDGTGNGMMMAPGADASATDGTTTDAAADGTPATDATGAAVTDATATQAPATDTGVADTMTDSAATGTDSQYPQIPEGMTPPDGAQIPEGMTPPEGAQDFGGMTPPDTAATDTATATNTPAATENPTTSLEEGNVDVE